MDTNGAIQFLMTAVVIAYWGMYAVDAALIHFGWTDDEEDDMTDESERLFNYLWAVYDLPPRHVASTIRDNIVLKATLLLPFIINACYTWGRWEAMLYGTLLLAVTILLILAYVSIGIEARCEQCRHILDYCENCKRFVCFQCDEDHAVITVLVVQF